MNKIIETINYCTSNDDLSGSCINCPYCGSYDCVDKLLIDAKEVIEAADRRMYNIEKMLTEWQMVDLRESLLREIALWHKQRGDSNE